MVELSRFSSLPKKIQLCIWHHAARQGPRFVQLNISMFVDTCDNHGEDKREHVVISGRFLGKPSQRPQDLIWPPSAGAFITALGATCTAASEAVLKEFPDVIRVERHISWSDPERVDWNTPDCVKEFATVRCNFEKDIFHIKQIGTGMNSSSHDVSVAEDIWWGCEYPSDIPRINDFRNTLRRIKNLVIDAEVDTLYFVHPQPGLSRRVNMLIWYGLFTAAPNLETLYICPVGIEFRDGGISVRELSDKAWEGDESENMPLRLRAEFQYIRGIYEEIRYRSLSPVCHDIDIAVVAEAGEKASKIVDRSVNPSRWRDEFAKLVEPLGFSREVQPLRELPVRMRTSADGSKDEEAVWVPRPGYVVGLQRQSRYFFSV